MNKHQLSIYVLMIVAIWVFLFGSRDPLLSASGVPEIYEMIPHRNEGFPQSGGYIVIKLIGNFTPDTEVVIEIYEDSFSGTIPPISGPTHRLDTITILRSNGVQVMVPLASWSEAYKPAQQTLSAVVASNSDGTDIYYFSVLGHISYPLYYRGGLP
jgi:hypothetical protein